MMTDHVQRISLSINGLSVLDPGLATYGIMSSDGCILPAYLLSDSWRLCVGTRRSHVLLLLLQCPPHDGLYPLAEV